MISIRIFGDADNDWRPLAELHERNERGRSGGVRWRLDDFEFVGCDRHAGRAGVVYQHKLSKRALRIDSRPTLWTTVGDGWVEACYSAAIHWVLDGWTVAAINAVCDGLLRDVRKGL